MPPRKAHPHGSREGRATLPFGKLDHARLGRLLRQCTGVADPALVVGPAVGQDAAAVRLGRQVLVAATDPVTFTADRIGWYAVHINANDVAVMGARPRWFQACLLLPPCPWRAVQMIMADIHRSCRALGVTVTGGHTEVTVGLDRPIVVGTMLGLARRVLSSAGARAGDVLMMTKGIAIEGTAILARHKADELARVIPAPLLRRAGRFLTQPGISVVTEALVAAQTGAHAMHDPTEGGLLTGIWEMAEASGLGVEVDLDAVPVRPEAAALCGHFGLDVYYTLTSGTLLIAQPAARVDRLQARLHDRGIPCAVIGRFLPRGRVVRDAGRRRPLHPHARDEITRLFD